MTVSIGGCNDPDYNPEKILKENGKKKYYHDEFFFGPKFYTYKDDFDGVVGLSEKYTGEQKMRFHIRNNTQTVYNFIGAKAFQISNEGEKTLLLFDRVIAEYEEGETLLFNPRTITEIIAEPNYSIVDSKEIFIEFITGEKIYFVSADELKEYNSWEGKQIKELHRFLARHNIRHVEKIALFIKFFVALIIFTGICIPILYLAKYINKTDEQ